MRPVEKIGRIIILFALLLPAVVFLTGATSHAQSFDVQPVKVFFNGRSRAEKLVVTNVSGGDLSLQAQAFTWAQDKDGNDVYEETSDIVIFPRILIIPRGEQRIIRLGAALGPSSREGTYRVYLEELPIRARKSSGAGAGVRLTLRVGIPVFVSPVNNPDKKASGSLTMEKGKAVVRAHNDGNTHLIIQSIRITGRDTRGAEVFSKNLNGWYLLGGASRTHTTDILPATCRKLSEIRAVVSTTKYSIEETLPVTGGMCAPQAK
ncbi:MAG TPA: hypothetical protein DDZ40_06050 [Deltaproteobacteria bacterium]|nr:hypothetical protein [Deltaproteobacteria bacterium]